MRELISEGITDRSIGSADVKMLAFTLAGALNGPAQWYDPKGKETAKSLAAKMVDILTTGLARR